MNENALMQHLSYGLHTYVRRFDLCRRLTAEFCAIESWRETSGETSELFAAFFERLQISPDAPPHIFSVNGFAVYSLIAVPDGFFLVGPTGFQPKILPVRQLSIKTFPEDGQEILALHEYTAYAKQILLLRNLYYAQSVSEEELLEANFRSVHNSLQKDFNERIFRGLENQTTHNPYDQELREQSSIEHGDLEGLKKAFAEDYVGSLGVLASTPLRSQKNLGIVVITLASRSAIRGGVLPEVSFSLSDSYIQQLEKLRDAPSVLQLTRNAEIQYTEMVREIIEREKGASRKKSPYIEQCKSYIFSHLHDKITLETLAAELNVNANYLSGLFKKHQGVSLSRYILEEKINRAKNLLTYSTYSYIDIAAYLGFSSQSHFSAQFKHITGHTPKEYRDAFGVKDF